MLRGYVKEGDSGMKRILSLLCMIALLVLVCPTNSYAVESATWTTKAYNEWGYQDAATGTDITVKFTDADNKLTIIGTGVIPAFGQYEQRPWENCNIYHLEIDNGITSIGANAFSGFDYLMKVWMYANTFIEDVSAFKGAREECIFYIKGMDIVNRGIGKVPYTSLDSIVDFMQAYNGNYRYVLENYYMIGLAQNITSPKIEKITPQSASKEVNAQYPIINYKSTIAKITSDGTHMLIEPRRQGKLAYEVFSILMGENNYACAYNIVAYGARGTITQTTTESEYCMIVPAAYQYPGRSFSLIQIANGECNVLADLDMHDGTVTFATDTPTGVYALVYSDMILN